MTPSLCTNRFLPVLLVALAGGLTGFAFSKMLSVAVAGLFVVVWAAYSLRVLKKGSAEERLRKDAATFLPFFIMAAAPLAAMLMPSDLAAFSTLPRNTFLAVAIAGFAALKVSVHSLHFRIKHPQKVLWAAVITYIAVFSLLSVLKHDAFNSTAFDLGIFDQTLWGYAHGENIFNTIRGLVLLGDHAHPLLFLLAPLYWTGHGLLLLLVLQSAFLGLAAVPIYHFSRETIKNETPSLLFALAYLFFPVIHYINLFDFHPAALVVLPLAAALYWLKVRKLWAVVPALAIVAMAKEHYALLMVTFGIYAAAIHRKRVLGATITLLGAAWFVFNIKVLIPAFSQSFQHLTGYAYLGNSFGEVIANAVKHPFLVAAQLFSISKLAYLLLLTLPLGFGIVALFAPDVLFVILPAFAINVLRDSTGFSAILYQHNAELIPFLFAATVVGMHRMLAWKNAARWNAALAIPAFVLAASVAAGVSYGPFATIYGTETFIISAHAAAGRELAAMIPDNASVSASTWAVPHLSQRKEIYMFPNPFYEHGYGAEYFTTTFRGGETAYVLIDTSRQDPLMNKSFQQETAMFIRQYPAYSTVAEQDGWLLLKRIT